MIRIRAFIVVLAALVLAATTVVAQSGLGNITGQVTDPSGAAIARAQVSVTNNATHVRINTVANGVGIYEVLSLNPGNYTVEASAPSFKKLVRSNILVQSEDKIGLDLKLEIGSSTETVTVTPEQSQLRREDAQTGEVITNTMIEDLPTLAGNQGRDPLQLLVLSGDVQGGGARAGWSLGDGGGVTSGQPDTRINGGRTGDLEYLVDGVPATGGFVHNVVNDTPSMDAVEEFKVITNGVSAEYGRLSGGLVSVTTKSGTNADHGQLFEYNQNAYLNANTWDQDALCAADPKDNASDCVKPNFRLNDFGFAIGGPVTIPHIYNGKSRTFFFANYEGVRHSSSGTSSLGNTITPQEIKGDLTDIGTGPNANYPYPQIYDPFGPLSPAPVLDPFGNTLYEREEISGGDGRHINPGELDPIVQAYLKLMPAPNHNPIAGSGTAANYQVHQPNSVSSNIWAVRIDQVINDKQRLFARFTHNGLQDLTGAFYPTLGTTSGTVLKDGFGAELHYTFNPNPTTVVELQTGGNFSPFSSGTFLPSSIKSSSFGYGSAVLGLLGPSDIVRLSQGPETEGQTYGSCNCQYSAGFNGNTGSIVNTTNFSYSGALTKILNRHAVKFGYEGRRYYDNFTQQGQSNTSGGISDGYAFDGQGVSQFVGENSQIWTSQGYANSLGQYLLGVDTWVRITEKLGRSLASNYYAAYAQDDFKVNSKLTLNLGLRWETETPVTERHNNLTVWDPNAASPFYIDSGWSWGGALATAGYTPSQISQIQTPSWVLNGFPSGAVVTVSSPQHPSRHATIAHPYNFAPRLGAAYQFDTKTVISGSFAWMYLPTSGNLGTYGDEPGVTYATQASNNSNQTLNVGGVPGTPAQVLANPWPNPSDFTSFTRNPQILNAQAASSGTGAGGMSIYAHMPHEFDWSLGIQRQLPNQWLLELTYAGNASNTLLTVGNPSRFPKGLYTGGPSGVNHQLYENAGAVVPSPTAGQIPDNGLTGLMQPLGVLEYQAPYFGPVIEEGENIGNNQFESGQARVERRFANGFQLLFNYTYSKALDDTGGSDNYLGGPGNGTGSNGKSYQQVDASVHSVYGLSSLDETHRIATNYTYDLPFGRGRKWVNNEPGLGGLLLDWAVGGWQLSGDTLYHSGTPVSFNVQGSQADKNIYIFNTFGSLVPGDTLSQVWNQHPSHNVVPSGTNVPSGSSGVFNINAIQGYPAAGGNAAQPGNVQSFTYGNIPANTGLFRNPGVWVSDLSVMKGFSINHDGSRYFQLRLDAPNFLNHAGLSSYDNNTGDNTFGYITAAGNTERHLQIGGRLVF